MLQNGIYVVLRHFHGTSEIRRLQHFFSQIRTLHHFLRYFLRCFWYFYGILNTQNTHTQKKTKKTKKTQKTHKKHTKHKKKKQKQKHTKHTKKHQGFFRYHKTTNVTIHNSTILTSQRRITYNDTTVVHNSCYNS